jgi:hypothetical protein
LRIFIGYNRAFHRHLAELASNIRIRDQLGDLIDQMERAVLVSVKNVKHGNSASLVNEHCRIIDALQARQARRGKTRRAAYRRRRHARQRRDRADGGARIRIQPTSTGDSMSGIRSARASGQEAQLHGLFIDGREVPASRDDLLDVVNPATGELLTRIAHASDADVESAVQSARAAFESPEWAGMSNRKWVLTGGTEAGRITGALAGRNFPHQTLELGGRVPADEALRKGYFVEPTVFADVTAGMRIFQEEVFGPFVSVTKFSSEEEAIALANNSPFGLAGAIRTDNITRAHRVAARLKCGIVWINDHHRLDPASPWGGVKDSGIGRECGGESFDQHFETKSVMVRLDDAPFDWYRNTANQPRLN